MLTCGVSKPRSLQKFTVAKFSYGAGREISSVGRISAVVANAILQSDQYP